MQMKSVVFNLLLMTDTAHLRNFHLASTSLIFSASTSAFFHIIASTVSCIYKNVLHLKRRKFCFHKVKNSHNRRSRFKSSIEEGGDGLWSPKQNKKLKLFFLVVISREVLMAKTLV